MNVNELTWKQYQAEVAIEAGILRLYKRWRGSFAMYHFSAENTLLGYWDCLSWGDVVDYMNNNKGGL